MRSNQLLWTLVLLIAFVGLTVSAQDIDGLVRRQDKEEEETASTSIRIRSTTTAPSETEDGDSQITPAPTETEKDSEDDEEKDTKGDNGSTSVRVRSSESIRSRTVTTKAPVNSPPGAIQMVTPAASDGFQLYPFGTQITWVYNYTGVLISPTAVHVEAFVSKYQRYYTIAHNYSVKATKIIWDTEEYQKTGNPGLVQETYALLIYDAATQKTDVAQPGKLGPFSTSFAMYSPKGNIPKGEYKCNTCSAASSLFQSHSVKVLLGTSILITLGFTWFIHGAM